MRSHLGKIFAHSFAYLACFVRTADAKTKNKPKESWLPADAEIKGASAEDHFLAVCILDEVPAC